MKRNVLLLIDPQVDFCEGGALAVPGGQAALDNVAGFIKRFGNQLDEIVITLDSHNLLHIAHPIWFLQDGKEPDPFTTVMEDNGTISFGSLDANGDFHQSGTGTTRHPGFADWTIKYLKELNDSNRYPHMLWPPHCLIGTPGACMVSSIIDATQEWERKQFGVVSKVTKGSDIKVEHFGALRAEVENPANPETKVNSHFLQLLSDPDATIYGAGLARGHCLANTCRDTADEFDGNSFCERFVLLEDGTADVANLEHLGQSFVDDFTARGMKTAKTTDF